MKRKADKKQTRLKIEPYGLMNDDGGNGVQDALLWTYGEDPFEALGPGIQKCACVYYAAVHFEMLELRDRTLHVFKWVIQEALNIDRRSFVEDLRSILADGDLEMDAIKELVASFCREQVVVLQEDEHYACCHRVHPELGVAILDSMVKIQRPNG